MGRSVAEKYVCHFDFKPERYERFKDTTPICRDRLHDIELCGLSENYKAELRRLSKNHSKRYMFEMVGAIKNNYSFDEATEIATKNIGR